MVYYYFAKENKVRDKVWRNAPSALD